ncbi:hypothetical protein [Polyangium aurulentum]|uniref:hypothetical protein n=1 Tax=Polyangium aurulentum TaxID=2567896 RepID=UPI0010AEA126|nr:hypothetical protein [Polyangium aurulentum]UQA58764.1 hypothetical protein E8A73_047325 [Polyangium aurulentum]
MHLRRLTLLVPLALLPLAAGLMPSCTQTYNCEPWDPVCGCEYPAPPTCKGWMCPAACFTEECVMINRPPGEECAGEPGVCDGNGSCVECVDDTQCGEGGFCRQNACARCDDGIQNGDEKGVDCGGPCGICLSENCDFDDQCASGHCSFEGNCCTTECGGCYWCITGTCEAIPPGYAAYEDVCPFPQLCNGYGGCGKMTGVPCTKNEECWSLNCVNGKCAMPPP